MRKNIDVAYRNIDIEIPEKIKSFFNYINDTLELRDRRSFGYETVKADKVLRGPISVCGGATRDLLLNSKINDIDVIMYKYYEIVHSNLYNHVNGKFSIEDADNNHPHHIFNNDGEIINFHPIDQYTVVDDSPESDVIVVPGMFDFSINEIHLNSDYQWYASPLTWFDYDNKILRMNTGTLVTSQIAIRTIRLAAKCHLRIEANTLKNVAYKFKAKYLNEKIILPQLKKCVEDNVGDICFDWLKLLDYPNIKKYGSMSEMIDDIDEKIALCCNFICNEPNYSEEYE